METEAGWKINDLTGAHVANVDFLSRETRTDDQTGNAFEQIRISSPATHLEIGKYQLVSPDGDVIQIQVFDDPIGGVYTVGMTG